MSEYTITADSAPDYDDWGPDSYWGPQDWITWHRKLVERYGRDEANRRFLTAYHRASFGAASYDYRTFDGPFRRYAQDNGFYEGLFPGISVVPRLLGSVLDFFRGASQVGEAAPAVGESLAGVSRLLPLLIVVAGVVFAVVWYRRLTHK